MAEKKIPLSFPSLGDELAEEIKKVLDSGWLIAGEKVKRFEERFASYTGVRYGVALNSCTSALQLALLANEIKGKVIIPDFTFPATANAVINAGCKPVMVDVLDKTFNIDPVKIENALDKDIKAVIVVHFAGLPCDMDQIVKICQKHRLLLIEDSAQTIGGMQNSQKTGSFGVGCFSFFPTKNMTTGEGGMITTSDFSLAEKIRILSSHGIKKTTCPEGGYVRELLVPGFNYRMTDLQAVIGLSQLENLERFNSRRRHIAEQYRKNLSYVEELSLPMEPEGFNHVYQMFVVRIKREKLNRGTLMEMLRKSGIETGIHYDKSLHDYEIYKDYLIKGENYNVSSELSRSVLSLPVYPDLCDKEVEYICMKLKNSINNQLKSGK